MEPVNNPVVLIPVSSDENLSFIEQAEVCCLYTPVVLLTGVVAGGTGFAFWTAFGTGTLKAASIANIAYDAIAAASALFTCGCYIRNIPRRSFKKDINKQEDANIVFKNTVKEIDQSIENLHLENTELKETLNETYVNMNLLKDELEQKRVTLLKLSNELQSTLKQLNDIKDDFAMAKTTINDAKKIIASMIHMSKKIKKNIKSSKVAVNLFKDCNKDLKMEVKHLDFENRELADLLRGYSKIIIKEHSQFSILLSACDQLNQTCQMLKKELDEFTDDSKQMAEDIDLDVKNTSKLESLSRQLEILNKQLT